ncbi:MAG: hypothetical protein ACD_14C00022G0003 [uncultured bacterium]|nr:MAG: hypothetical protein ACD_14C00022G0003 [uncultured bacterium]
MILDSKMILKKSFYARPTLEVAKELLGCILVREIDGKKLRAVITEVEAYIGEDDLASHASKGRTPRTELMFGQAGHAYVYMIYGMYYCLNIITEKKNFPAAVLIRAVTIEDIEYKKTNGPGKLCRELRISRNLNGIDMTLGRDIWIEKGLIEIGEIVANERIGIDYAKHCKEYPWRFTLKDFVGKK